MAVVGSKSKLDVSISLSLLVTLAVTLAVTARCHYSLSLLSSLLSLSPRIVAKNVTHSTRLVSSAAVQLCLLPSPIVRSVTHSTPKSFQAASRPRPRDIQLSFLAFSWHSMSSAHQSRSCSSSPSSWHLSATSHLVSLRRVVSGSQCVWIICAICTGDTSDSP